MRPRITIAASDNRGCTNTRSDMGGIIPGVRESPSPDFDWVTARAHCTTAEMFEVLRRGAELNVTRRNVNMGADRFSVVVLERVADYTFAVRDTRGTPPRRASSFRLVENAIHISPYGADAFIATVTLSDTGECKFKVIADELDAWQVLKRGLEELLFGPHA